MVVGFVFVRFQNLVLFYLCVVSSRTVNKSNKSALKNEPCASERLAARFRTKLTRPTDTDRVVYSNKRRHQQKLIFKII